MTDAPMEPYTVLLMLPDDMRADECCEADWVRRVHVEAADPDSAFGAAQDECASAPGHDHAPEDFAPVAIYEGHQFDLFQP